MVKNKYYQTINEHKILIYVVIPFILTYLISHFTVLILLFLNSLLENFSFKESYNTYIQSGSMLTTSISILVTACLGYYFSPLKPTKSKLTITKILILIITFIVIFYGIFGYIMSANLTAFDIKVPIVGISYLNFFYSMVALITFNYWNFKADGANDYLDQEAKERTNLHK